VCKSCGKHFLYVASLKKHLQNLHPDIYEKLDNSHDLEEFCNVIKSDHTPDPESEEESPESNSKPTPPKKVKQIVEVKEESKRPLPNPIPAGPNNNIKLKEPEIPPEVINPNTLMGQYYPSVPTDVFSLAYSNPFIYHPQNYNILCMLHAQAAKQNETLRQSDFWMQKLAGPQVASQVSQNFSHAYGIAATDTALPPQVSNTPPTNKTEQQNIIDTRSRVEVKQEPIPIVRPEPKPFIEQRVKLDIKPEPSTLSPVIVKNPQTTPPPNGLMARSATLPTLPSFPMPQCDHHHIHCEFCGHCTIRHNGHIDYVHDAELHHVSSTGIFLITLITRKN